MNMYEIHGLEPTIMDKTIDIMNVSPIWMVTAIIYKTIFLCVVHSDKETKNQIVISKWDIFKSK